MRFRTALLCSGLFHVGFMGLTPPSAWVPSKHSLNTLEVFYVSVPSGPEARAVQAPVPDSSARAPSPPPRPAPPQAPKAAPRPLSAPATPKAAPPPLPATGSVSVPEQEFASVEHKEWVRRHLKAHLSYPSFLADGTVRIGLLLGPAGALREVRILESSDPRLAEVALRDAQKAAPYPRFTQPMRQTEATYEFLVRYQPEERSVN